jgi:putative PIN family toxin of toxin-antitoxin system
MPAHRAVVDTNVLYAGLYSAAGASHHVLRLIEQGRVVPILSTTLLFEYEDVLRRNGPTLGLSEQAIGDVLDGLCARAECRTVHFLWRPVLKDPKDDHVLELAVAAGGADVVTHNVADFRGAGPFGLRIITPAELLRELR